MQLSDERLYVKYIQEVMDSLGEVSHPLTFMMHVVTVYLDLDYNLVYTIM